MRYFILLLIASTFLQSCQDDCECGEVIQVDDHDADGYYNVVYENFCDGELTEVEYQQLPTFQYTNVKDYDQYTNGTIQYSCDYK